MVDNRSFPFSAVGLVNIPTGALAGHGSGVLIAPDEFLTAAHVVWTQGVGAAAASDIQVAVAVNGSDLPFGLVSVTDFHYVQIADPGVSLDPSASQEDFALLHLAQPLASAGTMSLRANFGGGAVSFTGYPGTNTVETNVTESVSTDATMAVFNLGAVAIGGTSGGPIWIGGGGAATVVGIGSSQSFGAALSTPIVTLLNSWITADHSSNLTGAIGVAPIDIHTVSSATDHATVSGGLGGDSVTGSGVGQWLVAGVGNESLTAAGSNATIFGGAGADTLVGSGGGTFMLAGSGATRMIGGPGIEAMGGGASSDVFEIHADQNVGYDAIFFFGTGDKIQIHAVPGSVINTPALAEAFELGDGSNTFGYLGNNASGAAVWLIVVGTPHVGASQITFI